MTAYTRRATLAFLASGLLVPGVALAKAVRIGGRSVWVPDNWVVEPSGASFEASSPDESTYVVANERAMPVEGLLGVNAAGFIFDELENVRGATDKVHVVNGEQVRTLTGTGTSEGDPVKFWFRLAAARTNLVTVLIYADSNGLLTLRQGTIDRILNSVSA
ncbi:MAG: hypothetical protein U1E62_10660 [Alsobacter sp.]